MAADAAVSPARVPNEVQPQAPESTTVNDAKFFKDLTRLRELRSFLIQEAVRLGNPGALDFGELNVLQCAPHGRAPTKREWSSLESRSQVLFGCITEPVRRRFLFGQIPMWVVVLPLVLMLGAMLALMTAVLVAARVFGGSEWHFYELAKFTLPIYMIWLMLLGALGSMAFVGMNALSVQQDITFDVTNRKLMVLRITLGALFGVILTLPFGFDSFTEFIGRTLFHGTIVGDPARQTTVWTQATYLLLPFILGFSTPLVITVLNRLVDSVQAFFGRASVSEPIERKSGQPEPQIEPAAQPFPANALSKT